MITPNSMFNRCRDNQLSPNCIVAGVRYELRFARIFDAGRGYAFPCDAHGHVDMDSLGEAARANYIYARALVGRDFFTPVTRAIELGH